MIVLLLPFFFLNGNRVTIDNVSYYCRLSNPSFLLWLIINCRGYVELGGIRVAIYAFSSVRIPSIKITSSFGKIDFVAWEFELCDNYRVLS